MTISRPAIGIDIGGTNLRVACVDREGRVTHRSAEAIDRAPAALVRRILKLCRDRREAAPVAIGIGVPGRVDARRRTVLSGGFVDLAGLRLAETIEEALGLPVQLDNDGNMALRAEMALGAGRGVAHVAMLTIGTGIGGALALDGRIVHGGGTAGQFGHLTVAPGGEPCLCGRRGCVETTSSGSALARLITEARLPAGSRVEDLLDRAASGDEPATQILTAWAAPLRIAIDTIVASVSPALVLLGGGLGAAAATSLAFAPAVSPWYQCEVRAAALGDDAGAIGAGLAAFDPANLERGLRRSSSVVTPSA